MRPFDLILKFHNDFVLFIAYGMQYSAQMTPPTAAYNNQGLYAASYASGVPNQAPGYVQYPQASMAAVPPMGNAYGAQAQYAIPQTSIPYGGASLDPRQTPTGNMNMYSQQQSYPMQAGGISPQGSQNPSMYSASSVPAYMGSQTGYNLPANSPSYVGYNQSPMSPTASTASASMMPTSPAPQSFASPMSMMPTGVMQPLTPSFSGATSQGAPDDDFGTFESAANSSTSSAAPGGIQAIPDGANLFADPTMAREPPKQHNTLLDEISKSLASTTPEPATTKGKASIDDIKSMLAHTAPPASTTAAPASLPVPAPSMAPNTGFNGENNWIGSNASVPIHPVAVATPAAAFGAPDPISAWSSASAVPTALTGSNTPVQSIGITPVAPALAPSAADTTWSNSTTFGATLAPISSPQVSTNQNDDEWGSWDSSPAPVTPGFVDVTPTIPVASTASVSFPTTTMSTITSLNPTSMMPVPLEAQSLSTATLPVPTIHPVAPKVVEKPSLLSLDAMTVGKSLFAADDAPTETFSAPSSLPIAPTADFTASNTNNSSEDEFGEPISAVASTETSDFANDSFAIALAPTMTPVVAEAFNPSFEEPKVLEQAQPIPSAPAKPATESFGSLFASPAASVDPMPSMNTLAIDLMPIAPTAVVAAPQTAPQSFDWQNAAGLFGNGSATTTPVLSMDNSSAQLNGKASAASGDEEEWAEFSSVPTSTAVSELLSGPIDAPQTSNHSPLPVDFFNASTNSLGSSTTLSASIEFSSVSLPISAAPTPAIGVTSSTDDDSWAEFSSAPAAVADPLASIPERPKPAPVAVTIETKPKVSTEPAKKQDPPKAAPAVPKSDADLFAMLAAKSSIPAVSTAPSSSKSTSTKGDLFDISFDAAPAPQTTPEIQPKKSVPSDPKISASAPPTVASAPPTVASANPKPSTQPIASSSNASPSKSRPVASTATPTPQKASPTLSTKSSASSSPTKSRAATTQAPTASGAPAQTTSSAPASSILPVWEIELKTVLEAVETPSGKGPASAGAKVASVLKTQPPPQASEQEFALVSRWQATLVMILRELKRAESFFANIKQTIAHQTPHDVEEFIEIAKQLLQEDRIVDYIQGLVDVYKISDRIQDCYFMNPPQFSLLESPKMPSLTNSLSNIAAAWKAVINSLDLLVGKGHKLLDIPRALDDAKKMAGKSPAGEESKSRCAVCAVKLLKTEPVVKFGGKWAHSSCGNFWIHRVRPDIAEQL